MDGETSGCLDAYGRGADGVCVEEWDRGKRGSHYQQCGHKLEHGHKLELHRASDRIACVLPTISHRLPKHSQGFVPQGLQRDAGAEPGRGFCHPSSWQGSYETGR